MKKQNLFKLVLLALFVFMLSIPLQAGAASYRYAKLNGKQVVYRDGKLVKNAWVGTKHYGAEGYLDTNKFLYKYVNGVKTRVFVRNDGEYILNFTGGPIKIGQKIYMYKPNGKFYKNTWVTITSGGKTYKYYVLKNGRCVRGLKKMKGGYRYFGINDGIMRTGWQKINNKYYCFKTANGIAYIGGKQLVTEEKKYYYFSDKGVMLTGWKNISGKWYYFKNSMQASKWVTIDSKTYYMTSSGARATGVFAVGEKLYYFDPTSGVLQKNKTITYGGRKYILAADGTATLVPGSITPTSKMLFFLKFESGSAAYDQTGGDNGNACGAYQFDNRYSLLPFVKYAYAQNATLCKEFKTYSAYKNGTKLKSNNKFYKAWHAIYARNPKAFAAIQDKYATLEYYTPVEQALYKVGINLATRSDAVKGAVFSYSIQHGQTNAVNAVKELFGLMKNSSGKTIAAKLTASSTDKQFIKKLYNYRAKKYSAYKTRYISEKALALSLL